ncbi:MAG: TetR/AcrR family transcriptional regulator [Pelomonas sp.]|nr:TetR/AcrR family transcriptional regulator [Roseateles sp.]
MSQAIVRPDLERKRAPLQPRAVETFERILSASAQLLGEVGIERISTNLVCQRAGISPPALYQYFPNKYAILHELSLRLMAQQNHLLRPWAVPDTFRQSEAAFAAGIAALLLQMHALTEQSPAGVWVTRALRAVPVLQSVRHSSHEAVTDLVLEPFMQVHPKVDRDRARLTLRLSFDVLYAAHELLFDEPELDAGAVAATMSEMVAAQIRRLTATGRR